MEERCFDTCFFPLFLFPSSQTSYINWQEIKLKLPKAMSYFVHDSQWQEIFLPVSQTTHVLTIFIPSCGVKGVREGEMD